MRSYYYCLLAVFLLFTSCEKDEVSVSQILTTSVKVLSSSSIQIDGEVKNIGSRGIVDYGIVYTTSNYNFDENSATKVSFGKDVAVGSFTKEVKNVFFDDNYYQNNLLVRAYITDSYGTIYGNVVSVEFPSIKASAITPSSGKSGDKVKILGNFYDPTLSNTIVKFEGVDAKVLSVNDKEIEVEVPSTIRANHGTELGVSVKVGNIQSYQNSRFTILAHIKDFTPKTGPIGTKIDFIGDNLPGNYYYDQKLQIYLDGNLLEHSSIHGFKMPLTSKLQSKLSIAYNGKLKELGNFDILIPQISSISPFENFPSDNIVISGINFPLNSSDSYGNTKIKIGNTGYQDLYYYETNKINYTIPENLKEGEYPIYILYGAHEIKSATNVKIKGISATSFSPKSGQPGSEVSVVGDFKENTSYSVKFGNIETWGNAHTRSELRVIVPGGGVPGKVKIKVNGFGKDVTLAGEFEILGPTLTSFSPMSAVAGTVLTLKGENFAVNSTQVLFGTTEVYPIEMNETTIKVTVPSNLLPGAMKLNIRSNGQLFIYDSNFTLLN